MTKTVTSIDIDADRFGVHGFVLLRSFFDPGPLMTEFDRALRDGLVSRAGRPESPIARFEYVPMMSSATPVSLALLGRLEIVAERLLGGAVIPTRAKAVCYRGDTAWHADSSRPLASLGFAAYLEAVRSDSGALRVIPGSHRAGSAADSPDQTGPELLTEHVVSSDPGDIVVFDEHLLHASSGGRFRRQWRVDYLLDPVDTEAEEQARGYFADIYPADWDGGYDVDRYPTYGLGWRQSRRHCVSRLESLGVYELAERQEEFMRSLQRT